MKITESRGADAIRAWATVAKPILKIGSDTEVATAFRGGNLLEAVGIMLDKYPDEVLAALAAYNCTPVEEYAESFIFGDLPGELMDVLNNEDVRGLFPIPTQKRRKSSGSASENTEDQTK